MAGLFDTLSLGSRSLATYRQAIDTTGHNLANVSTPGYTRQRLVIESSSNSDSSVGPMGTGAEATKIVRIQNDQLDRQAQVENSVQAAAETKLDALQQAQAALQESIDRNSPSGTSTGGISQGLADFFASVQNLSANVTQDEALVDLKGQAIALATNFNRTDARLADVQSSLNQTVQTQTGQANDLIGQIAKLNSQIISEEAGSGGIANDLRDSRQLKLEDLSKLVKVDTAEQPNGGMTVMAGGVTLVDGGTVENTLESFDPGNGELQVRAAGQATPLNLTGGSITGAISVRDNEVAALRNNINSVASTLITQFNQIHAAGFSASGTTGANFFTGTNASDIQLNSDLAAKPALIQTSGSPTASGDNSVARQLSALGSQAQSALDGLTFSARQAQTVATLGQQVSSAQSDVDDQGAISQFVQSQRDSIGGVSVDEEMSNLVMFQKAFEASAKLISMTDEMLTTIIQM
jgi:flagellar hook-associated protein 1 FlgK